MRAAERVQTPDATATEYTPVTLVMSPFEARELYRLEVAHNVGRHVGTSDLEEALRLLANHREWPA